MCLSLCAILRVHHALQHLISEPALISGSASLPFPTPPKNGGGVVIASARGMTTGGYATWEPIEGRQLGSLNPLVPSNPQRLCWECLHLCWKCSLWFSWCKVGQVVYTMRPWCSSIHSIRLQRVRGYDSIYWERKFFTPFMHMCVLRWVVRHSDAVLTYAPMYWPKEGICARNIEYSIKFCRDPFASRYTKAIAQPADCVCCAPTKWCGTPRIWAKRDTPTTHNEKITKLTEQTLIDRKMLIHQSHSILNVSDPAKPLAGQPAGTQSTTILSPIKERLYANAKTK